jgi:hypothetical protein
MNFALLRANERPTFGNPTRQLRQVATSFRPPIQLGQWEVGDYHAAANLPMMNKMALDILKRDTKVKIGRKAKRKTAGWERCYLANLLISVLCKD